MKIPLMPKGVEHEMVAFYSQMKGEVKIPLMPKGVEHATLDASGLGRQLVKIPLMPKGVEHIKARVLLAQLRLLREDSIDAERR